MIGEKTRSGEGVGGVCWGWQKNYRGALAFFGGQPYYRWHELAWGRILGKNPRCLPAARLRGSFPEGYAGFALVIVDGEVLKSESGRAVWKRREGRLAAERGQ